MYTIISVGGSIIIPKSGFDIPFLKKFRKVILDEVRRGKKFILVVGGGATCRLYQQALGEVTKTTNTELDWLGIYTTIYNAQFVRLMFGDLAHKEVLTNPRKKIQTNKKIIVAGGEKPGQSSDGAAVQYAKTYKAKELINLSNIEYVYDKDPSKFPDAQKIEKIGWNRFRKEIVGMKWIPGKNVPFDPTASREAQKLGLQVDILKGTDLNEVKKVLRGKKFKGTVVG